MSQVNEHAVLEELYGAMQTFRILGFPSDNLYLAFNLIAGMGPYLGQRCMGVTLRWEDLEFSYHIAPVADDRAFADKWLKFADDANKSQDPELLALVLNSYCFQNKTQLLAALLNKGISPP
jgi:hypothetical protein